MPEAEEAPCKGMKFLLMTRLETASALCCSHPGTRAVRGPSSEATLGQQNWARGWTHSWAEVPHLGSGVGASVYKESACDTSSQNPCRITYCGRTLPNTLLINFFFYI